MSLVERLGIRHWSQTTRIHVAVVSLFTVAAIAHHCVLFYWYIEDAAISFAYAKHLAMGEGLVPFVGAERVEGYSNPLWVFFLAPFSWVYDLHEAARWLQVLLVVPTVPLVWLSAREVLGRDNHLSLVAPAILAISSQYAIWAGAGLEIALMNFVMAAALWRSLVEVRTGEWPFSALLWFLVTLCRPEAILYAAVAGFCAMVFQLEARRGLGPTLRWLATYFVPFGLYHAWRFNYFAWELPNTYYAKLERRSDLQLFDWHGKAWGYTRDFLFELRWGFFLPVWVLGILGDRQWRLVVASVACLALGLAVELPGPQRFLLPVLLGFALVLYWMGLQRTEADPPRWLAWAGLGVAGGLYALAEGLRWGFDMVPNPVPTPDWVDYAAPYLLVGLGLGLPALSFRSRGWQGRVLTWLLCVAAIYFALLAQWDWMKGFRWYAPAIVPSSVLFALGTSSLAAVMQRFLTRTSDRPGAVGYATAIAVVLLTIPGNVDHTYAIAKKPQTEPRDVRKRVNYVNGVRDRLQVDERFVDLDVDQGAHLYWSDFEMLDIAGLIDIPMAHHKFQRPFLQEYLFEERLPHFLHVHGNWADNSGI